MAVTTVRSPLGAAAVGEAEYERNVRPVLKAFCSDCHTRETSEERWAFDAYEDYGTLRADQDAWARVAQFVEYHIMPPHGEAAPTLNQRRAVLDWIDNAVFHVDAARPDPGQPALRRLNRAEYNNTVRDVLGVDSAPADQFPADDSGYGFDNIGDVLSLSPLHLEKHLAAARQLAEDVTRLEPPPRVGMELNAEAIAILAGDPERTENAVRLSSGADQVGTTVRIPQTSFYRVLIRAASPRKGSDEAMPIDVLCDGDSIAELETSGESYALVELPAGEHRIALRVSTDTADRQPAQSGTKSGTESDEVLATIRFLAISGPFAPTPPQGSVFVRHALPTRRLAPPVLRLSGESLGQGSGRSSLDTGRAWFSSNGYRHAPVRLPAAGGYRLRFKVGAQQAGDEPVRFEVRLGERTIGPFAVTARSQAEQWIETTCELPSGVHDWQVWFINEYTDPETGAERWFWLHEFTIEGPQDGDYGLSRDDAVTLLGRAARRLFRRPLTNAESQKLVRLVDAVLAGGHPTRTAVRTGLEALLVSPKFLYHPQPEPAGDRRQGTALIDELTLASRLSSFLWSSAPDEMLLSLAERGELRREFEAQVRRMIHSPKSRALADNFAGQWLQLRDLAHISPDATTFPDFDVRLAADMRRETELVFNHILYGNRSVLEFLDADYTFVNARLAQHYGLPVPADEGFQRVSLTGTTRRGVVTHGSVLTITSLPTRTSPVKRGKWLLEQLLGAEPPPPPGNIPPLPAGREDEDLPLRARLEHHVSNPTCASCHALLDPMGLALENYDAIGRWRKRDSGRPIDASGELITGERFANWTELRELLARERRQEFTECFVKQLLTYALGRGLTYRDKTAVHEILTRAEATDYGFQDLILAVCESVPFQRMRIEH